MVIGIGGDRMVKRRLKCMSCLGYKFFIYANLQECDGGTHMDFEYKCIDCGERLALEWVDGGN